MTDVLRSYIEFFGLNYQPVTFVDLFSWLVLVLCALSIVICIIRVMLHMCAMGMKGGIFK